MMREFQHNRHDDLRVVRSENHSDCQAFGYLSYHDTSHALTPVDMSQRSGNKRGATQIGAPSAKPAAAFGPHHLHSGGAVVGNVCLVCKTLPCVDQIYCAPCRDKVLAALNKLATSLEERA